MTQLPEVAAAACSAYRDKEIDLALEQLFSFLPLPNFHGARVLIKPNILTDTHPKKAVTTHPTLVSAVCHAIMDLGGKPVIGDSPSIQRQDFIPKHSQIEAVCSQLDIPWIDFTQDTIELPVPGDARVQKQFTIARAAAECDHIVNLPKLKTHQLMYTTGAVKNLFGLVPGLSKSPYHVKYAQRKRFADMLLDLSLLVRPTLNIMDAVISMEGAGPSGGDPIKTGLLLGSADPYVLDLAQAAVMGEVPAEVPVLQRAHQRNLLRTLEAGDLTCQPERPESFCPPHFKLVPKQGRYGFLRLVASHITRLFPSGPHPEAAPVIDQERCISCMACYEICPADAITDYRSNGETQAKLIIDRTQCIRCYCCHEVCPVQAVQVAQK
ncbi:MAG: DUF362 domain-containing protein [Spirochaetota bacterium]